MRSIHCFVFFILFFYAFGQRQDKVDFTRSEVFIQPFPENRMVEGWVRYQFEVLSNVDSIFLDAKNMKFTSVMLNGKKIDYSNTGKTISITKKFQEGKSYTIKLNYRCAPKQTVYFMGWDDEVEGNEQVWTQGQGKYTSHWLPSFDDMNEKVEFDLNIVSSPSNKVIANGQFVNMKSDHNGKLIYSFDMNRPMSSYLLAFVIGDYHRQELVSESGIVIENYYAPKDSLNAKPTYRHTKAIFDFLESEIGVPYPWQNYKQIPVRDFLYAGMENTGTTIFSDGYVIDSTAFVDKNYVNVNAHELAHQWFGNLVTEVDGHHHWLHEGFATYYAYLAEKALFGNDHYYWKLYRSFKKLRSEMAQGRGQSLLDPKASSLVFYEKGALALHMLRNLLGDIAFQKGIQNYLNKYQFKNVTVSDFLAEMESAGATDLSLFKKEWLDNSEMPTTSVKENFVRNAPSLQLLFKMQQELEESNNGQIDLLAYWNKTKSVHLKQQILRSYSKELPEAVIKKAFDTDTIPVRQVLSQVDDATRYPKAAMESLLDDDSYVTKENALLQLWVAYPENRAAYLNKTKNVIGLPNRNIRLLWLTLAVLTNGYEAPNTKRYFDELSGYTDKRYSFEVRQIAFQYLKEAFGFTEKNLLDLIEATSHHSWQFKKFARGVLDDLLKDEVYKTRIALLVDKIDDDKKQYLQSKLN